MPNVLLAAALAQIIEDYTFSYARVVRALRIDEGQIWDAILYPETFSIAQLRNLLMGLSAS
jgi:hypothetical protein